MVSSSRQFFSCSLSLLVLVLVLVLVSTLSLSDSTPIAGGTGRTLGGWTKISDAKSNQEVQALGKFSVEEYDRNLEKHHDTRAPRLSFARVVEAEKQVVSGIKYHLKIVARDGSGGAEKVYDAMVLVKAWLKSKELLSFTPSRN